MTNKELIDILHNIPQEIFQSKNHEKLHVVFHRELPRITLYAYSDIAVVEVTLYDSIEYSIWNTRGYRDIKNQIESYLHILGFVEKPPNLYSSVRYTPKLAVAINNTMTDTEIMKLIQLELDLQK